MWARQFVAEVIEPGKIIALKTPSGPGVRDDGGAYPGATISSFYDPLVSKLSVWAPDRARAIAKMRRALMPPAPCNRRA